MEELIWYGVQRAELILIRLRTRQACTAFKWVNGHEDSYGNNRAGALANEGREADAEARPDEVESTTTRLFGMEQDYRPSKLVICTMHSLNGIPKWYPLFYTQKYWTRRRTRLGDDRFTPHKQKTAPDINHPLRHPCSTE